MADWKKVIVSGSQAELQVQRDHSQGRLPVMAPV